MRLFYKNNFFLRGKIKLLVIFYVIVNLKSGSGTNNNNDRVLLNTEARGLISDRLLKVDPKKVVA